MKFTGSAGQYYLMLSGIEALCAKVAALKTESFDIDVSAAALSEPQGSVSHGATCYDAACDVIRVNQGDFDRLSPDVRRGFILHEMGHAMGHRGRDVTDLGRCIDADLRIIAWGLGDEVMKAAIEDCGPEYGAHLKRAQAEGLDATRADLALWKIQVRSGAVKLPSKS